MLAAQFSNQLIQLVRLFRVQPGRRFVQHQDLRARHHAARNLQTALLAVSQIARLAVSEIEQPDALQPGGGAIQRFALAATKRRRF